MLFQKATPAAEVADVLWAGLRDNKSVRDLASAVEDAERFETAVDEIIYFLAFAIDFAIHRVFNHKTDVGASLHNCFIDRVRDYAQARRCPPCPVGDWFQNTHQWHIESPGRDTGDPLQHLSDRFDLYVAGMRRRTEPFWSVVGVLCALCDTRTIDFDMLATALFVDWSGNTQDFLQKIKVKP